MVTQFANGATSQHLFFGKSYIFWSLNFPCIFLHVIHLWVILFAIALALSTQILFFLRLFKVKSLPLWPVFSWLQITVPQLSALTSSKNNFSYISLNTNFAAFPNISSSSLDCLSDVCFLILFIHLLLANIKIAISFFIFNHFRVSESSLEITSSLILAR